MKNEEQIIKPTEKELKNLSKSQIEAAKFQNKIEVLEKQCWYFLIYL